MSLGPSGILSNCDKDVVADATALGLSTPEMPNQAEAKSGVWGGRSTGSIDGGEMHVFSALETASLTA